MSSSGIPSELSSDTNVCRSSRGNQAGSLSDLPEVAQDVVTIQWRADRRREDQAVILPQRSGLKPVSSLKLVVTPETVKG